LYSFGGHEDSSNRRGSGLRSWSRGTCIRRAITGDTALRLAHFFGTPPEFWLNLQSLYEIRLAEQKSGKSINTLPTLRRSHLALSS
jgi:hypothetical protein